MRGGRYPKYLVALWGSACNDHMHTSPHKENLMKRILTICSLSFFAFGCVSFAANQESGSVSFPNTVRVVPCCSNRARL